MQGSEWKWFTAIHFNDNAYNYDNVLHLSQDLV